MNGTPMNGTPMNGARSRTAGSTRFSPFADHFWERTSLAWHALAAGFAIVAAAITALDESAPLARRGVVLGLLAVWAVAYVLVGMPSLCEPDGSLRRVAYSTAAVALCVAILAIDPGLDLLLYVTTAQAFMFAGKLRFAIPLIVLLFGGFALSLLANDSLGEGTVTRLIGSVVFAALIGAFITGIANQSERRAELISELEATREQLAAVSHERGALAERARLSREIHDTLAQGFTSVVMLLEAADVRLRDDPDGAARMIELARQAARDNLAEARAIVATLSPAGMAEGALVETLHRLVDGFGRELDLTVTMNVVGPPEPMSAAHEVVLLRCCQEALANVRKHAAARLVEVRLEYLEQPSHGTRLTVRDDGRGFNPASADGFGLHGMRDRVADVGGDVRVASTPGAGTTLEVSLP